MTIVIPVARGIFLCASFLGMSGLCDASWQDVPGSVETDGGPTASEAPGRVGGAGTTPSVAPAGLPILPKTASPGGPSENVDWTGLVRASGRFLAIEQSFRLLTEPGTR